MTRNEEREALRVPYALAVHGAAERRAVLKVLDEHKTILGPRTESFEAKIATLFGKRYGVMVNSGSSANLLALQSLNLPRGSQVITPALTFSTTVAPLVQLGLVPAFVDSRIGTYQVDLERIEQQITTKTRALMIPLLLGNVPDMKGLRALADKHDLAFIEDSCDTLGAQYRGKPTGSYSDLSTTSFYGSHIITGAGGGGMVCTQDKGQDRTLRILRGWGRRSSGAGESEAVDERFHEAVDGVEYDAKFVFDAMGYNFLPLELSAAFAEVQLGRLAGFERARTKAFKRLQKFFSAYDHIFVLPQQLPKVKTNWLAYPLTIRQAAGFTRREIATHLEQAGIQTRTLFSGNLTRHPGFKGIDAKHAGGGYPVADDVMQHAFVIGCHHGLKTKHLRHIEDTFREFLDRYV